MSQTVPGPAAPTHSEVRTTRIHLTRETGYQFRIQYEGGLIDDLITDEPVPLGDGAGPNPAALLGSAVGNCLASSFLFCLSKAHLDVRSIAVDVAVHMVRNEKGRMRIPRIDVRLAPEMDAEVREKMGRCLGLFESFCAVTESVRQGIDVRLNLEPVTTGG